MSADPRYTLFAARAVFDERLTAHDIRVLAALGTYSDKQGWCYPSQGEIARRCAMSRQSVNTSVGRLVEFGYVQASPQITDRGRQANVYRVLLDLIAPESALAAAETDTAKVFYFPDFKENDSRVSTKETGLPLVGTAAAEPLDAAPPVNHVDSRLLLPVDTPCHPTLTAILDRARDPHKNIPKEEKKRASRLPATWTPRTDEINFGKEGGLTEAEVLAAADHMRDWAASSPKASKLDWDRTFRNWLRTAISDAKRGRRPVVHGATTAPTELDRRRRLYAHNGTWRDEWGPRPTDIAAGASS